MPLLVGTDGVQKMSKSLDNYIGVFEAPDDIYGKVMSIPDGLIMDYFELLTDVPENELSEVRAALESASVNPMEPKKRLARDLVAQLHDPQAARQAEDHFESTYQRGNAPEEAQAISLPVWVERLREEQGEAPAGGYPDAAVLPIVPILVGEGLAASTSEAKRLLQQGAIELDGERLTTQTALLREGSLIRVGRRRFARFVGTAAG